MMQRKELLPYLPHLRKLQRSDTENNGKKQIVQK